MQKQPQLFSSHFTCLLLDRLSSSVSTSTYVFPGTGRGSTQSIWRWFSSETQGLTSSGTATSTARWGCTGACTRSVLASGRSGGGKRRTPDPGAAGPAAGTWRCCARGWRWPPPPSAQRWRAVGGALRVRRCAELCAPCCARWRPPRPKRPLGAQNQALRAQETQGRLRPPESRHPRPKRPLGAHWGLESIFLCSFVNARKVQYAFTSTAVRPFLPLRASTANPATWKRKTDQKITLANWRAHCVCKNKNNSYVSSLISLCQISLTQGIVLVAYTLPVEPVRMKRLWKWVFSESAAFLKNLEVIFLKCSTSSGIDTSRCKSLIKAYLGAQRAALRHSFWTTCSLFR